MRYKLLDGTSWKEADLLQNMAKDEFYYGYLSKAALSSSSLKQLLDSPRVFQEALNAEGKETKALREGRLIHELLLEPHKEENYKIVEVKTRAAKAFKEAVEEYGAHRVYTGVELATARKVANSVRNCPPAWDLIYGAATEVPAFNTVMGLPFRAKADILHKGQKIVDLKTTADLSKFKWSSRSFSYDLQAALYLHIFGLESFTFLVVDKSTYDVGIFETSEEFLDSGRRKIAEAIEVYIKYFEEGANINEYVVRGIL